MKRKRSLILLTLFICSYGGVSEAWKYEISGNQLFGVAAGWNTEITAKGDVWMNLQGLLGNEAAVYAGLNGKIDLSGFNTSIQIKGKGVVGAYAKDKKSSITFSGTVNVSGKEAVGIYSDEGTIYSKGDITAAGECAKGIYAENSQAKVSHAGNVTVDGEGSIGIFAERGTVVFDSPKSTVKTTGAYGHGLKNVSGAIDFTGSVVTEGKYSYGLCNEEGTTSIKGSIKTSGEKSHGVHNGMEGKIGTVHMEGDIQTFGDYASGFWNSQDGIADFQGTISTSGKEAWGIVNERNTMDMEGSILTKGEKAAGIRNEEGEVNFAGGIDTAGDQAYGIYAVSTQREEEGKSGTAEKDLVTFSGNISTSGESAHGIYAEGGDVTVKEDSVIMTEGIFAEGIRVEKGQVHMIGSIFTSGDAAAGIHGITEESTVNMEGMIITGGERSVGIHAEGSQIDFAGIISTEGVDSAGIKIEQEKGDVNFQGAISTGGDRAHGVYIENGTAMISEAEEGTGIYTVGESAYGIFNQEGKANVIGDILTEGDYSYGVRSVHGETTINGTYMTTGAQSHGVFSSGGTTVLADGVLVSATGENAYGIYADRGAQMNLAGDATIIASLTPGSYAIRAEQGVEPQVSGLNQQEPSRISGTGQFFITGGIYAGDGGDIRLNFKEGSAFEGATEIDSNGYLEMNMKDSYWKVTGDSRVSHLSLNGTIGSVVDFRSDASIGTELTIDNYEKVNNHAVFALRTDIAKGVSDKVIVTDSQLDPNTNLMYVEDITSGQIDGSEVITMARIDGDHQNVFFGLSTIEGEQIETVDSGGFRYGLIKDECNWNLKGTQKASTTASASVNTFAGAYLLSYAENQTLMQRLGDLRNDSSSSGVWFKVHGGEFESRSGSIFDDFKMKYWGVQAGIDKKISSKDKKADLYVGGMFGYSKGDMDYDSRGSGTIEAKTLGLYGTYKRNSGFYADLLLKYMWMDNDFDVINLQGSAIHGDEMSTDGFGASLEIGKRVHFDSKSKSGWYVEPQAQISYLRQNSGDFYASNGLHVNVDSYTSLLGRVGTNK